MLTTLVVLGTVTVVAVVIIAVVVVFRREEQVRLELEEASSGAGPEHPISLHPVIDLTACIGSAACVKACPEHALGRVDGLTHLVQAGECIGHGRCQNACPVDAISLVFGTAERGVDIPLLYEDYESNVDGVFIVGELGGMGLIRNAMRQGLKAVEAIPRAKARPGVTCAEGDDVVDVIIVGGGPAGVAAAIGCVQRKLSFVVLEQYSVGGSVTKYPRRKLVFSEEIELPVVGTFGKSEMLKDELVAEFERVLKKARITVHENHRVTAMTGNIGDFTVTAEREDGTSESFRGRTVVLAIGRRGTPRRLEVTGEELPHVVYRLIDSAQYRHRKVLCVGGGDSSVEAAVALSKVAGCEVHLSYRGETFFRCKKKNRRALEEAVKRKKITLHTETVVRRIRPERVTLKHADGHKERIAIDDVIVNIGGVLPTPFLESLGIVVETKHGEVAIRPTTGRFAKKPSTRRMPPVQRPVPRSSRRRETAR